MFPSMKNSQNHFYFRSQLSAAVLRTAIKRSGRLLIRYGDFLDLLLKFVLPKGLSLSEIGVLTNNLTIQ